MTNLRPLIFVAAGLVVLLGLHRAASVQPAVVPGAFIPEALNLATSVKAHVAEYFATEGRFPDSNAVLDLQPAALYATEQVAALMVSSGGVITVRARKSGDMIRLVPSAQEGALSLAWRCESPNIESISRTVPACVYRPGSSS